jgi:guanylate kinase
MSRSGRLFVVSAPSGTGKTTLLERLQRELPGLIFSVSHTTRAPRRGEVDGRQYHFVSGQQFEQMIAEARFLEWAEVYGDLYGTARAEVERHLKAGLDVLCDLDAQGARAIREASADAVLVLVLPPSWTALERRLRRRGTETEATIQKRLMLARQQLESYGIYRYAIVNDELEAAYQALQHVVQAERSVLAQSQQLIESLLEAGGRGDRR